MTRRLVLLGGLLVVCAVPPARAGCPGEMEILAGVDDSFLLPTEPTFPSEELVEYTDLSWPQPTYRTFDLVATDAALIHTFSGWDDEPICGASVELRLRGGPSSLSNNDSVRFELIGGDDHQQAFRYWTTIRFVVGAWGPGAEAVVELDLADLPPYVNFPTNILADLQDGDLDLLVEDDTAVDYAELELCPCETVAVEPASWGRIKARYRP